MWKGRPYYNGLIHYIYFCFIKLLNKLLKLYSDKSYQSFFFLPNLSKYS